MKPRLLISTLFLLLATNAFAAIGLQSGPEIPTSDTNPARNLGGAARPQVTSDGRNFLAVWVADSAFNPTIHAMLVGPNGELLMPTTPLLGFGPEPDVASNGRTYLVVRGALGGTTATRISATGQVLDSQPIVVHDVTRGAISQNDRGVTRRRVAWDGNSYVITSVYERLRTSPTFGVDTALMASMLSDDGRVVANEIPLAGATTSHDLAANHGVSIVAWSTADGIFARPMIGGAPGAVTQYATSGSDVAIAAGPNGFFLTWQDANGVKGQHLDPSGRADVPSFDVANGPYARPAVTWSGSSYLVSWSTDEGDVLGVHVDARFRTEPNAFAIADAETENQQVALAWNGTRVFAAYVGTASVAKGAIVHGSSVDPEVVKKGTALHVAVPAQSRPQVVFTGNEWLTFWEERAENFEIYAARMTPEGRRLDGRGKLVVRASNGQLLDAVRGNGATLLLWSEQVQNGFALRAIRVGDDGDLLDAAAVGFPALACGVNARAAWNGADWVVLFGKPACEGSTTPALYALRLAGIGGLADRVARLVTNDFGGDFAFAQAGNRYFAAYRTLDGTYRGLLLDSELRTLTSPQQLTEPAHLATDIAVASNGVDYFLAWRSPLLTGQQPNDFLMGVVVTQDGAVLDDQMFTSGLTRKGGPRVEWNGTVYVMTWAELAPSSRTVDIQGIRITSEGRLVDLPPYRPIAQHAFEATETPSANADWDILAAGPRPALVYARMIESSPRVVLRPLGVMRARPAARR